MRSAISTITDDGMVALPPEVQRQLGVGANDPVEWLIDDDGSVRVIRSNGPTLESVRGAAGSLSKPLPWDEVLKIAREDAACVTSGGHGG
ncbi:MAG TPA: AbrB/MazE/SpoVT family DNA-binding domain-containing protein [Dehalococcoidia bacterium]|nr:AbrB/MazE/SpoVT family DNA-binding domain-containing protein [Dehalococcoidia bacterium]